MLNPRHTTLQKQFIRSLLVGIFSLSVIINSSDAQSLSFRPLTLSNGSFLCVTDSPMLTLSVSDSTAMSSVGIPDVVRCAYHCTALSSSTDCIGFNYIDNKRCLFFNQPPQHCSATIQSCTYYQVRYVEAMGTCKETVTTFSTTSVATTAVTTKAAIATTQVVTTSSAATAAAPDPCKMPNSAYGSYDCTWTWWTTNPCTLPSACGYYPHVDSYKFIQCANGLCNIQQCPDPVRTHWSQPAQICDWNTP